jgi:hypothetical protein
MILVQENDISYHDLSECTLSPEERRKEATKLADIILDEFKDRLTETEFKFLEYVTDDPTNYISVKQLFWLRDIKDKYL